MKPLDRKVHFFLTLNSSTDLKAWENERLYAGCPRRGVREGMLA
jgi:hypothetical protein